MDTRARNLRLGEAVIVDRETWWVDSVRLERGPAIGERHVGVVLVRGEGLQAERQHRTYAPLEAVHVRDNERQF